MERQTASLGSNYLPSCSPIWQKLRASFGIALLPFVGAFTLLLSAPKPQQGNLNPLLSQASLAQSLPVQALQPPPQLWKERLSEGLAKKLWRNGSGSWLQIWGPHGDAAPLLLVRAGKEADAVPLSLRWGPYRVVAADALGLQGLKQLLEKSKGLRHSPRCAALDGVNPGIFWSGSGLVAIAANWSPLLVPLQQGCLQLEGRRWWGQTRGGDSVLRATKLVEHGPEPTWPQSSAPLLLQGDALSPLLAPLLAPLLDGAAEKSLLQSPFQLQLQFNPPKNPYQASIWIALRPKNNAVRANYQQLLRRLENNLPTELRLENKNNVSLLLNSKGWVQAGWRWLATGELLVVLGAAPTDPLPKAMAKPQISQTAGLKFVAVPRLLDQRGLLPEQFPVVLKRSTLLRGQWLPGVAGGAAQLTGDSLLLD